MGSIQIMESAFDIYMQTSVLKSQFFCLVVMYSNANIIGNALQNISRKEMNRFA